MESYPNLIDLGVMGTATTERAAFACGPGWDVIRANLKSGGEYNDLPTLRFPHVGGHLPELRVPGEPEETRHVQTDRIVRTTTR